MSNELSLRNRQRARKIDLRSLRRIITHCLEEVLRVRYELSVQLADAAEITRLNEQYLQHAGSTDVITFDYRDQPAKDVIHGDIIVCVDEAIRQARTFQTAWQEELVRYIVHGILHLRGYDDRTARLRGRMKRAENKLVAELIARFQFRPPGRAHR